MVTMSQKSCLLQHARSASQALTPDILYVIGYTSDTLERRRQMSNKVKVSMFFEPEVARAVKVQAARQGAEAVSGLVRNVCFYARLVANRSRMSSLSV
jgi:hypothetical protein